MSIAYSTYRLPEHTQTIFPHPSLTAQNFDVFAMSVGSVAINGTMNADNRYFHFQLYLIDPTNQYAIRFNMNPSNLDRNRPNRGGVTVEFRRYARSRAVSTPPFVALVPPGSGLVASQFCYLLFTHYRMDRYDFHDGGVGCRHWCATALERMVSHNYVLPNSYHRFLRHEVSCHEEYGKKFPMPRIEGSFY